MGIRRCFFVVLGVIVGFVCAEASQEFIRHRLDCFKAVPASRNQIIFLGNSITNFHCWADAFAHPDSVGQGEWLVCNRGISDGRAYQWKNDVQALLDGDIKPAKILINIGTNDLNVGIPTQTVVNDIRAIVRQIQLSSPQTEIIVQSIVPRRGEINKAVEQSLPLLKAMANDMGVMFIDLTETLARVPDDTDWAYDGLHPSGKAYRAWCGLLAPHIGLECSYTDASHSTGSFNAVTGVRAGQYGLMRVTAEDIIIVGDDWTDAIQWHEFFGNHHIKNRSSCHGKLNNDAFKELIDKTLKANAEQQTPRAMVLCRGAAAAEKSYTEQQIISDYEELIAYTQSVAPGAKIMISQVLPLDENHEQINAGIMKITSAPVINLNNAGLSSNNVDEWYMAPGLSGEGARRVAQAVGTMLNEKLGSGTARMISASDFKKYYDSRSNRIEVAKCYNALYQPRLKASIDISESLTAIESILKQNTVTEAQMAEAKAMRDSVLNKITFMPDTTKWYQFSSPRGLDTNKTSVLTLSHTSDSLQYIKNKPTVSAANTKWRFSKRDDNTYDIINSAGYYLASANDDLTLTKHCPGQGWSIHAGLTEPGTYSISSNNVRYADFDFYIIE